MHHYGHDISNSCSTPLCFHAYYLGFTLPDFLVKHVRTHVPYIVFPIVLLHIWTHTFLYTRYYHPPGLEGIKNPNSYLLRLLAKHASQPPSYLGSIINIE